MAANLAELVQLKRAEEQANSARVRWEMRTAFRRVKRNRAEPLRFIGVRLPIATFEALKAQGLPAVVARDVLVRWARPRKRGGSRGGP